jgi:hypothetical protein
MAVFTIQVMHTAIYDFVTGFRKRQEMQHDCLHFERNITLKAPNLVITYIMTVAGLLRSGCLQFMILH